MKLLMVAVAAVGVHGAAMAQPQGGRWTEIGETDERTVYIDVGSARRNGQQVTIWQRGRYFVPQEGGTVIYDDRARYDCSRRSSTLLEYIERRADETVIVSGSIPQGDQEAIALQSGTVGDDILNRVCRL